MSGTDLHHLAAAYALDALDPSERADFEAHYHDCEICVADVVDFRNVLTGLAAVSPQTPPADLKARVMADIATTRQLSPRVAPLEAARARRQLAGRRVAITAMAIAASLVLAVGTGFLVGRSGGNSYQQALAEVFDRPDLRMIELSGDGAGEFHVAWSPEAGQAVVTGDGLVDPGDGKVYELWLINDKGPQPLGLLDNASDGTIREVVDVSGDGAQMGVTIEQEGGAQTPTMPILFAGETT
jgi:anti-sigma-K factor RskA